MKVESRFGANHLHPASVRVGRSLHVCVFIKTYKHSLLLTLRTAVSLSTALTVLLATQWYLFGPTMSMLGIKVRTLVCTSPEVEKVILKKLSSIMVKLVSVTTQVMSGRGVAWAEHVSETG